jgi:transcriptional regulator NrdR family protein
MYCGKCGNDNNKVITQEVEQDGNTVVISYYGVCEKCGEPLGIKEFFKQTAWDYIDKENVKKALDKHRKVWYNV